MKYTGLVIDDWCWKVEKHWELVAMFKLSAFRLIDRNDENYWRQDEDINDKLLSR